jgi:hypothetical protein
MGMNSFEESKNVLKKYVLKTTNVDVIADIIANECGDYMKKIFVSETGKFLTDSFTFLKEMDNVPQCYRERLFNSFFGRKKSEYSKKWYKKIFRNDRTHCKHLSTHVNCLMAAFINEQKRKYGIENVKDITTKKYF